MSIETEQQTYIDGLGITRITVGTVDYDDEFTRLLYQTLTVGRDNIMVGDDGNVMVDDDGNVAYSDIDSTA